MRFLGYLVGALSLLFASPVFGQTDAVEKNLVKHVEYLTSDPLMGRKAGSEGEKLAAKYLYQELKGCGVEMLSGEEGQDFYIVESGDSLKSRNIVGIVEGYDPKLKNEYVVIGANLDNIAS